ncbi:MAG: 4Fe-4S binding protein, partial [Muribaculaceae bacterium]|nr:4Fe-4S binding protein [Muribaculaceae bacterium]
MLKIDKDKVTFDLGRCQQCGVCEPVCPKDAISLKLRADGTHDVVVDHEKCVLCGRCVRACPSNVINDYSEYFSGFPTKKYYLGYNTDKVIRRHSSSGGVCRTLIIEALKSKTVDGVYTITGTDEYPYAKGHLFTTEDIPDIDKLPNSVYHSVPACADAGGITSCRRMMIVGTSCQLRALAPIARNRCEELVMVCIFCKQQKT